MKITLEINLKNIVGWTLSLVLVLAGLSKIANPTEFLGSLMAYKLPLPELLLRFTAVVLPWLELLSGLLLVAGSARRAALVWATALFAVFVLATGQAWGRGLEISCGCMNLNFNALDPTGALGRAFESVQFAFFRALLLLVGGIYLLRKEGLSSTNERPDADSREGLPQGLGTNA
jgi:uncharacterized membrane protein YphA (DoxX/SURF4 family)